MKLLKPKKGDKVRFRLEGVEYQGTICRIIYDGILGNCDVPQYEIRGNNIVTTLTQEYFI